MQHLKIEYKFKSNKYEWKEWKLNLHVILDLFQYSLKVCTKSPGLEFPKILFLLRDMQFKNQANPTRNHLKVTEMFRRTSL